MGRSPRGGRGNPLQYSWLENSMDRGAWRAIVHEVAKSQTWQKWLSMHTRMEARGPKSGLVWSAWVRGLHGSAPWSRGGVKDAEWNWGQAEAAQKDTHVPCPLECRRGSGRPPVLPCNLLSSLGFYLLMQMEYSLGFICLALGLLEQKSIWIVQCQTESG